MLNKLASMLLVVAAIGCAGCTIKLAPSTQMKMAELATQREFAIAYAQAVKTPKVATAAEQQALAGAYMSAAGQVNTFVNNFTLQVQQTQPGQTIDASRVDDSAGTATRSLEAFIAQARAIAEAPRPSDFGATAVAIAAAIKIAFEIAAQAEAWWQAYSERQRTPFIQAGNKLKMDIWQKIEPLQVP